MVAFEVGAVVSDPQISSGNLADRVCELSAHIQAATARLAEMAAQLDDSGNWSREGMRSCAHWLSVNTGCDAWTGAEIVRVGHALDDLPAIGEAFRTARLSFDKARAVTRVATPADEDIWLDVALAASGAQLTRICNAFRRSTAADGEDRTARQQAQRKLRCWWREDGMLELFATLPPEDAQVVLAAIESVAAARPAKTATRPAQAPDPGAADREVPDTGAGNPEPPSFPALDTYGARRADAFVRICESWLTGGSAQERRLPRRELVVHVDIETLVKGTEGGRCHLEDGPAITVDMARRIGCDANIVAVIERDGLPMDVGRRRRLATPQQRRALQVRDGTCRFPGCSVPASVCRPHHVEFWWLGGPTILSNQVSLCEFHHNRLHDGIFRIVTLGGGDFRFETPEGRPIQPAHRPMVDPVRGGLTEVRRLAGAAGMAAGPGVARAGDGGAAFELGYAVEVLQGARQFALARGAPSG